MAHITVDGRVLEAQEGELLIEVLLNHGIEIPHFCYHPSLGKDGNCRMCMVEIEGQKRPQIACDTPIKHGMIVRTKGANIDRVKRSMLELELINHPIDCPICDQAGECSLQNYYMDVGLYESRLSTPKNHAQKRVDLGSNVVLDQERCVLCTRCVRFTQKITKTNELGVVKRADHSVITTFPDTKLSNPYAMNIVDLCPVGALTSKEFRFHKRVWFLQSKEAICNHCARGCSLYIDHHQEKYQKEKIYRYRPRFNDKVNGYFICDAGRLSYSKENEQTDFSPLIRGKVSEYEYAQSKLLRLLKRYLQKTLVLLGANLSLEEMARLMVLARQYTLSLSGHTTPSNLDEKFGDDFLKCNDRTTNSRAFPLLGIDTTETFFEKSLEEAELVVLVGREDVITIMEKFPNKSYVVLSDYDIGIHPQIELLLPIASHMAKAGSYINIDGYLQYSKASIILHAERQNLLELIAFLLEDAIFTPQEVWENLLRTFPTFHTIDFNMLHLTPKIAL